MTTDDKAVWGPIVWKYLHLMSFLYPDKPTPEDKAKAQAMLQAVAANLPCDSCRDHFSKYTKTAPLDSRATFSESLVKFHNEVNVRLKKPTKSYTEVKALYEKACSGVSCPARAPAVPAATASTTSFWWLWVIMGLLLAMAIRRVFFRKYPFRVS